MPCDQLEDACAVTCGAYTRSGLACAADCTKSDKAIMTSLRPCSNNQTFERQISAVDPGVDVQEYGDLRCLLWATSID